MPLSARTRPDLTAPVGDPATAMKPPRPAPGYETRPFLTIRKAYTDVLAASRRKDIIHGLIEIDVTHSRQVLRRLKEDGHPLSFTAFLVHAVARAVDEDRILHAYRRRRRLIVFDDVDVNTQLEAEVDGQRIVQSLVIRSANHKSVTELTQEIRSAQGHDPAAERRYRGTVAFLSLPRFVRSLVWRLLLAHPVWFKRLGGTVAISSVGMFGTAGGWGIPVGPATLMITVGGIATRPRYVGPDLQPREMLDLTISVDHQIVDGAQAARFARRLAELVERGDGLTTPVTTAVHIR